MKCDLCVRIDLLLCVIEIASIGSVTSNESVICIEYGVRVPEGGGDQLSLSLLGNQKKQNKTKKSYDNSELVATECNSNEIEFTADNGECENEGTKSGQHFEQVY